MTSQLGVALVRNLRGLLMCLVYFFGMLSTGVCTTRHWQTHGRLVLEFNVCSVDASNHRTYHTSLPNFLKREPFGIKNKFGKNIESRKSIRFLVVSL